MKLLKPLFTFALFHMLLFVQGQELRKVTGVLKDNQGDGLPGVSITIKGSATGTLSDIHGFYTIKVPLGSTLVFNYIGFKTWEMVVTLKNSKPVDDIPDLPQKEGKVKMQSTYSSLPVQTALSDSTGRIAENEGTAVFSSTTPSFRMKDTWRSRNSINPGEVDKIETNGKEAVVSVKTDKYCRLPHVTFTSSVFFDKPGKLPLLQDSYAQGRPENGHAVWRGPETGEIFSWGPKIENLEFDGSSYAFDKNGRLVAKGTGQGTPARAYPVTDFFRTAASFRNGLKISRNVNNNIFDLAFNHDETKGIIPKSGKTGNTINLNIQEKINSHQFEYHFEYNEYSSDLLSDNPSLNLIVASVLTTPPTFDNANGFSPGNALKNRDAFEIQNGDQRSASSSSDNPYWLVNHLVNHESYTHLINAFHFQTRLYSQLLFNVRSSFEHQRSGNQVSYPAFTGETTDPWSVSRIDNLNTIHAASGVTYSHTGRNFEFNSNLDYEFFHTQRSFLRTDSFYSPVQNRNINNTPHRSENRVQLTTDFVLNGFLILKMTNALNSSSTLNDGKVMYTPGLSAGINFYKLLQNFDVEPFFNLLKIRAEWVKYNSDNPLYFSFGQYPFLPVESDRFLPASFYHEVLPDFTLKPERTVKKGMGMDFTVLRNRINLEIDYYYSKTSDAILPVDLNNSPLLKNLADYNSHGMETSLSCRIISNRNWTFRANTTLSFNRTLVTDLHSGYNEVPLGGFANIHTALVKGQPYGILVGTDYLRNPGGKLIIGKDGYPLAGKDPKVLGDPNPDYRLGLKLSLSYKAISLNVFSQFSKGGRIWNGTANYLSYLGLAQKTTGDRKVTDYIFPGVNEDGSINVTPVNFAGDGENLSSNRWVTYGPSGVAREAVQDATWFRIREVDLSYSFFKKRKAEISLFVNNPLLITSYSGVDPEITLWGQHNTTGLDMFNMPGTTRYGLSVKVTL